MKSSPSGYPTGPAFAPALLTIDLDALAWNWRFLADKAAPAKAAAVVKANGYGLGSTPVVTALSQAGCRLFFTAHLSEAIAVRAALPDPTIEVGVLNGLMAGEEDAYPQHNLFPVLNDLSQVDRWAAYCRAHGVRPAAVQVDSGMSRLGLPTAEAEALAGDPSRMDGFDCRYLMSHMACADEPSHPLNVQQRDRFAALVSRIPHQFAMLSASSASFLGPEWRFDYIRPGVALYGGRPDAVGPNPLRQVIKLEGKIVQIQDVDAPQTVGYGAGHKVEGPGRIATIGVGYADGYLRSLSNKATAVLHGVTVPLVGRVSMDVTTFDISAVPDAKVGDMLELIGPSHTIDDLADQAGTIGYEILTSLGNRYARRFVGAAAGVPQ